MLGQRKQMVIDLTSDIIWNKMLPERDTWLEYCIFDTEFCGGNEVLNVVATVLI
jgi:hypothetical protein